jgi:tryptophan halogenase
MRTRPLHIVIVGGGTAGWMCAAACAQVLHPERYRLTLIESDDIGTVGVGEATLPALRDFNELLRVDEAQFMRETQGTFKLGIEFRGWDTSGQSYLHPFGAFGELWGGVEFQHFWLRARQQGLNPPPLEEFCVAARACARNAFDFPAASTIRSTFYGYAYHFDAGLYANFLRRWAVARGVTRVEGQVVDVAQRANDDIECLTLKSGQQIAGDFFVDCSGFRSLLLGDRLQVGWEDWSRWLPCDRAWAVPSAKTAPLTPYTRATAREAGWQWRIPLQHRTGNGHVYCSAQIGDDAARETLLANLDAPALAEPRLIRFTTGRRKQVWNRNVVCMGLASGFLEPLESTSIHLIQVSIQRLILLFPHLGDNEQRRREFNRASAAEYEYIRDFIILHYCANNRRGEPFWDACRNMSIPDSLRARIELFRETAGIFCNADDLFQLHSWLQVLWGQGVRPAATHPFVETVSPPDREGYLRDLRWLIAQAAQKLPRHEEFIARHCAAVQPAA